MKRFAYMALAATLLASPAFATQTNPVFYDPETGLYYKDKGKTIPVPGPEAAEPVPGPQGPKGEPGESVKGDKGDKGEKGDTVVGPAGKDGRDGSDGRDANFDSRSYANDLAATAGIGGLELRKGGKGVTSWSAGIGAVKTQGGTGKSIAFGLHHGISDNWGAYVKVSRSIGGGRSSTAAFVGVEGQF